MKLKARPLLRIGVTIVTLVLLMTMLTRCGMTYQDAPPTNPLRPSSPPVSVTYRATNPKPAPPAADFTIRPDQADALLSHFDDSREDPHPQTWQRAGTLVLTDARERIVSIDLYTAGDQLPDAYRVHGVYYRNEGLLAALDAWVNDNLHTPRTEDDGTETPE